MKKLKSKRSNEKIDSESSKSEKDGEKKYWIDNLPKEKKEIEVMLRLVNNSIVELEK